MATLQDLSDHALSEILAALRQETVEVTDLRRAMQDFQIHQLELEIKNRELRSVQQALAESRDLYDFAPVAYATLDRRGRVTRMNLAAARLLGVAHERTTSLFLSSRLAPGGMWLLLAALEHVLDTGEEQSIEVDLAAEAEHPRTLRLVIHRGPDDPPTCLVALLDHTEQQRLAKQLQEREHDLVQLAHHDALTALPNRLLFVDRLAQLLRHARREQHQVALLFLDLDGLANINDSLGHPIGDRVLQESARRLREQMRDDDTVARFGSDEFTIVLGSMERGEDAALVAEKLLDAFKEPIEFPDRSLYVTVSIGISLYPQDGADVHTLVRNADAAMHQAKAHGRDCFQYYSQEMTTRAVAQFSVETALRQALAKGEFVLHYQPQHDLATGAIVGIESLIRWRHPQQGMIGAERFIPLAESSGLIIPIGAWVIRTAAVQLHTWREHGLLAGVTLWINLSHRELRTANLAERIAATLTGVHLEPGALAVEINDGKALAESASALANIRHLIELGIAVTIDDFGTGNTSLASLKRLAVRGLKIDGSVVHGLPGDANDQAIARAIIVLGEALGLRVVAECIETAEQAQSLKAAGCRIGQGYLFTRALPASEFEEYCRRIGTPQE
ncbi:EAL domain-containing protein [uncultured Thiodictyon sp.]|uniref:putative bifunctional diguanylate cyclase/phosphodiesterase n=1 Tax=uncultured Thiodictyon sp. TaxID=1846217 RepID=UPI0025D53908|nr:EAL domain-containing protein [uncultured Thiodictyon sp.]